MAHQRLANGADDPHHVACYADADLAREHVRIGKDCMGWHQGKECYKKSSARQFNVSEWRGGHPKGQGLVDDLWCKVGRSLMNDRNMILYLGG